MANEQTSYVGDSVKVLVNVIDATGSHAAAVIDTSTTRLDGLSTVPTVNTIATGIYEIVFSGVTPAPSEGDRLVCKVNGTMAGVAWTEYGIPVKIVADERGTDNVVVPTADITAIKTKTDELTFTISGQVDANALTGGLSEAGVRSAVGLASANLDSQLLGIDTATTGIKATTDQFTFTVANQVDANTLTGGISEAGIRSAVGLASANLDTQLGDIDTTTTGIKATTDQFSFTVANQVDANSLTGGTSPADIWTYATRTITSGGITAQEVEDAVWDASASNHIIGGTYGKHLRQIKEGQVSTDGEVNDASATAGSFVTNLSNSTDEFYDDLVIAFISGNLQGQSRVITGYNGTTKSLTVEEPFTSAPTNGDEFIILTLHVHPVTQITTPIITEVNNNETKIDGIKAKTDQFVFTVPNQVDANALTLPEHGGDATLDNQTTIIGMLSGASVVVSQSDLKVGDSVTLRQGMDYNSIDGTAISWTGSSSDQWPDLTGATVTFTAKQGDKTITQTATVSSPTGTQSFYVEFTAAELSATNAPTGNYRYFITALLSSGRKTTLITDSTLRVAEPYSSGE